MKILVGYDGSKEAEDALKLAQKHAKAFSADIYIVTSLEQSPTLKKKILIKLKANWKS